VTIASVNEASTRGNDQRHEEKPSNGDISALPTDF
jgi:hypothetical protein